MVSQLKRLCPYGALGHVPAELPPEGMQVLDFRAVFGRAVKGRLSDLVIAERNAEPRPEFAQFLFVQLLLLVRDVLPLADFAEPVALDRSRQDDGR